MALSGPFLGLGVLTVNHQSRTDTNHCHAYTNYEMIKHGKNHDLGPMLHYFQNALLMEYAAYLRIVPFAAQNHAANTPALHGASRMSLRSRQLLQL